MYKIINPNGVAGSFEGRALSEVTTRQGIAKKIPISVNLRGSYSADLKDWEQIDAFNILDIFIVSSPLLKVFQKNSEHVRSRKAIVFYNGTKLERDYFVLFTDHFEALGLLKATEADWSPNANYPVDYSYQVSEPFCLDGELKFPVMSETLKREIEGQELNVVFHKYPPT